LVESRHDQGVEHELIGVEFFGSAAVQAPEKVFDLVLEHGQLAVSGGELFGELFDLEIFLLDDPLSLFEGG
jgi:hypothetical protein